MAHSHSHVTPPPATPEAQAQQRRALRIMLLTLIPLAVWTIGGLIMLWPTNTAEHVRQDISTYSVEGLQIPTGEIVDAQPIPCDGLTGSTQAGGPDTQQTCGKVRVLMLDGPEAGQEISEITMTAPVFSSGVQPGQRVKLFRVPMEGAPPAYQFAEFERTVPLIVFAIIFAAVVILIAQPRRGIAALLGLAFAMLMMAYFIFPALISGSNPIMVGLIGCSAIMFVVLYATHGFSARTTAALLGTLFGLLIVAVLGFVAVRWGHLTGVGAEDDVQLAASTPDMQMTSVVLCGMIIAGLGVLNDVTITQASAVWEIAATGETRTSVLFRRGMRIGRDHIASTVYTIVFAYAGTALGTLLLLSVYNRPMFETIQTEMFATEILSSLVGAIGLVLAVPLTTAISAAVVGASQRQRGEISLRPEGGGGLRGDALVDR